MKRSLAILFCAAALISGCKTSKPVPESQPAIAVQEEVKPVNPYAEQSTWVLGYFNRNRLMIPPHSEWFQKGYDEYNFNTAAVNSLTDLPKDGITIKIVLGTWCPDSRRETPRFLRIIDLWQFPEDKITFIGVDNSKLSPVGEYESLDIQRVPTFIFYKNNVEVGRIIENPVTSLEQDIVNILTKE